ncbi:MAG TPA: tetratricopeptide repeat protein [Bryobacteraceae bacterium]|nr:tetratricopeptide repeat protein [Bryobacteraceae bacterium]
MATKPGANLRLLARNGYTLAALALLAILCMSTTVAQLFGGVAGVSFGVVLTGGLGIRFALTLAARRNFGKQVKAATKTMDSGDHRKALGMASDAIAAARKWKLRPDDDLAFAFVVRAEALRKAGDKQAALEASAMAFSCMCSVRRAHTQLTIFDQLGWLLLETGHARKAIPILEAAVGLGHRAKSTPLATAARLERAGMAAHRVGLHSNAAASLGKSIELRVQEKGADVLELAGPYINLGNCYKRMQKYEDAERCYREALRLHQVNHAENVEQYSSILLNLGVICAEQGRNDEAEQYYRQTLDWRIQTLGRNHWRVGNVYNNLAGCRRRARDFAGAEQYIQQAIAILEDRPEQFCNVIDTLSRLREEEGRTEEALAEATRAREIQQALASPDLSELATLFEREAVLAGRCGQDDRASDCRKRAVEMRQALATAPPADRDLTNLPESLKSLEQQLASSLDRVRVMEPAL